ncbi:MAG: hypothetical protein II375_09595 [Bacteroidales bacterium]|nr:hypothetical protein [Bacteroidales bacterium]
MDMSVMGFVNLVIVNVMIWVGLSYFWSFWTHKLFKPWLWLEQKKRGLIAKSVERRERRYRDRARYYSIFFAMEQVERGEVAGSFVMAGVEDSDLVGLLRGQCPEREMWVMGPMAATEVEVEHENCQGEVTSERASIDYAPEAEVRRILPEGEKNHVLVGKVGERVGELEGAVALALIDCVEYEVVLASLRKIYPLMSAGGIMIVHSYNHSWEGVRRAVDQFMAGVPEGVLPLPDMYGSVGMVRGSYK